MVGRTWETSKAKQGNRQILISFFRVASYVLVIPKLPAPYQGGLFAHAVHSKN